MFVMALCREAWQPSSPSQSQTFGQFEMASSPLKCKKEWLQWGLEYYFEVGKWAACLLPLSVSPWMRTNITGFRCWMPSFPFSNTQSVDLLYVFPSMGWTTVFLPFEHFQKQFENCWIFDEQNEWLNHRTYCNVERVQRVHRGYRETTEQEKNYKSDLP